MTQTPAQPTHVVSSDTKNQYARPRMYQVILLNDDFTPMDFVVLVLTSFFSMDAEKAVTVMLNVHNHGRGICGVFTKDIAETKMEQVNAFSRDNKHPLLCQIEPCTM